jgi:hypothetical protein
MPKGSRGPIWRPRIWQPYRIELESLRIEPAGFAQLLGVPGHPVGAQGFVTLQDEIVSIPGGWRLLPHALALGMAEVGDVDPDDRLGDLVLDGEDFPDCAVEPLGLPARMTKPLSSDLRARAVTAVVGGMSCSAAAERFGVAASRTPARCSRGPGA